jgi:flagella basal body P-ring formation protein FlgA
MRTLPPKARWILGLVAAAVMSARPALAPAGAEPAGGGELRGPGIAAPSQSSATGGIRLLDQAASGGPRVLLREVAELTGDVAQAWGQTPVGQFAEDERQMTVRRDDVKRILTERGAHWGRLSLRGFTACRVERVANVAPPLIDESTGAALSNVADSVDVSEAAAGRASASAYVPGLTDAPGGSSLKDAVESAEAGALREQVVAAIEKLAGVGRSELRINFAPGDAKVLALSAAAGRFEIDPQASKAPGRVPVVIHRYGPDQGVETYRVTADVARRYTAVVAKRTVGKGQAFTGADVDVAEVFVDVDRGQPCTSLDQVIGQTATALLRPGAVVYDMGVQAPAAIKKGDLISVRCVSGTWVVRLIGRADQDGALNQVITARNEKSSQPFQVRITGAGEGLMIGDGNAGDESSQKNSRALAGSVKQESRHE